MKCSKCHIELQKTDKITNEALKRFCLSDYELNPTMCRLCNVTESVISRLRSGKSIELDELKTLPKILKFEDSEEVYAIKLQKILEEYNWAL